MPSVLLSVVQRSNVRNGLIRNSDTIKIMFQDLPLIKHIPFGDGNDHILS